MKYNVILLDDDIYRAQQYIDKLNLFHFNALATDSIKDLLEQVRQTEFDAIILDINMLDKENIFKEKETYGGWRTGLALFHKIRNIRSDAKIVALTYSELPEAVEWFTVDDSVGYFCKDEYNPKRFARELYHSLNLYYGNEDENEMSSKIYDEIERIENLILQRLRSLIFDIPKIEKEVQNALESLFIGIGLRKSVDYDRETGKFNFSGREYIPDFILPKLNLCIEVKLLKDLSKKSRLIEEINADLTAYRKKYDKTIFLIYDLGNIRDDVKFKKDIENSGNIKVIVVKQ